MNIKPLFDRVLILPQTESQTTQSGIVLPETSQERPQTGVIVAVGDGENLEGTKTEMRVKVGDNVVFNKYIGTELKIEGKTHIVLRQIDIIGVIND
jgi:chaperonin GroES